MSEELFDKAKEAMRVLFENPLADDLDKLQGLLDLAHDAVSYADILSHRLYLQVYGTDVERDDPMDGDHQSALSSAGWGDDEDYGLYSDEEVDCW
jgi:hypothetical protein